jgi:hypothetical protein
MKTSTLLYSFAAAATSLWLLLFESESRAQPAPPSTHRGVERLRSQTQVEYAVASCLSQPMNRTRIIQKTSKPSGTS